MKIVKAKGPSQASTIHLRPSSLPTAPQNNNLLAEHAGGNNLANKVLLQAVLETENNVGGDVEESVRSQIFITPHGERKKDATEGFATCSASGGRSPDPGPSKKTQAEKYVAGNLGVLDPFPPGLLFTSCQVLFSRRQAGLSLCAPPGERAPQIGAA